MSLDTAESGGFGEEPWDVQQIVQHAGNFDFSPNVPLRYWLRSAEAIQKQAQSYERDGNEQNAYLFYMRHAILVVEKLPTHREIKMPQHQGAWKKANEDVNRNLGKLEQLKPRILKRRQLWLDVAARRKADREEWQKSLRKGDSLVNDMSRMSLHGQSIRSDSDAHYEKKELNPAQHIDIAAKLARKELRKRRLSKRFPPNTSELGSGQAEQTIESYDNEEGDDDLARRIIQTGRRGDDTLSNRSQRSVGATPSSAASRYNYPAVPQKSTYKDWTETTTQHLMLRSEQGIPFRSHVREPVPLRPLVAPERPPKLAELDGGPPPIPVKVDPSAPPRPNKVSSSPDYTPEPSSRSSTATPDLKSSDYSFSISAKTESGTPLRTVFLPPDLRSRFLNIAQPNTQRNLETCGILCGQLISNAFFITHLLIPEQESTSDTCDTLNEEVLFDYCDNNELITLGWIHTHPTQTCFMSSRDLHTHSGYQVQMAESIAIVCAPQHDPSWGVFRLTDPPGLKTVLNCTQTGLFHPHSEANVYTDALKPGHVWEIQGLEFEVVDLRPGRGFQ